MTKTQKQQATIRQLHNKHLSSKVISHDTGNINAGFYRGYAWGIRQAAMGLREYLTKDARKLVEELFEEV